MGFQGIRDLFSDELDPEEGGLNLPSIAGIFGLETDNKFLNWKGI